MLRLKATSKFCMNTLNQVYSSTSVRRRYEVWFLRMGLADGRGAWWFRYLLMNPGRQGCAGHSWGKPVQVWATWFPKGGKPQSFRQGFALDNFELSAKGSSLLHFAIHENVIDDQSCRGHLQVDGHEIAWDLQYSSSFHCTLSSKGWIGFSRTPHSDATFNGTIAFDGETFSGAPLGLGVQGHNCGYKHRNMWRWAHAYFGTGPAASTLEALTYDMPLGLVFRKAVLWHKGKQYIFRKCMREDDKDMQWSFCSSSQDGCEVNVNFDGRGMSMHRIRYVKTDCSGDFEVTNNSLATAVLLFKGADGSVHKLETVGGAVLEAGGSV
jgi:hypothetical protein